MNRIRNILVWTLVATTVAAQQQPAKPPAKNMSGSLGLYVYPAQGQNPQTQQGDEAACYAWAKDNTGFDPLAIASAPRDAQAGDRKLPGGAAAKGAGAGAAIGAISGDAGKGAATGAIAGGLRGRLAAKRGERQAAQSEAQAEKARATAMDGFRKSFGACMEAKGYTVK